MSTIIKDKDAIFDTDNYDVILVGTSVYCMLTGGFQSKIRFKYPYVDEANDKTNYGDLRKLGTRLTLSEKDDPIISLMYICGYPNSSKCFLDKEALERCLRTANAEFKGKKVMATLLGASKFDGNADKEECLKLIEELTPDIDLTIYDYVQLGRREEERKEMQYVASFKETDKEKYKVLRKNFNLLLKKLYLQ